MTTKGREFVGRTTLTTLGGIVGAVLYAVGGWAVVTGWALAFFLGNLALAFILFRPRASEGAE